MADVPRSLVSSSARWIAAKTLLVAPYYGADQDGTRGGWPQAFVERIRRSEFPQYIWDCLPIDGSSESILRLDQVQCIGNESKSLEILPYRLGDLARALVGEWLYWLVEGCLLADGLLAGARRDLETL